MAKDARGHGSNGKLGDRTLGGYDQGSGSSVTMGGHGGDWGNMQAAQTMASGPKSAPVAVQHGL